MAEMAGRVYFLTFIRCIAISSFSVFVLSVKECKKIDSCSCSTDEGEISLKKLAGTGGNPRFPKIYSDVAAFTFSWNPCDSYSLNGCSDVAACFEQTTKKAKLYYGIAKQNTADCVVGGNGECTLTYTGRAIIGASTFSVVLQCNETVEYHVDAVVISSGTTKFETVLHSKYACPRPSLPSSGSGLSIGSILVITFSCIIIVYIICGILLNKYARQVEGKEVFPNYSFWADFPYLIKDGCVFTFQSLGRLCGKGSSRSGYASI